ncbi:plasma-membrane proton-efflux P-type ATPase [Microbacter sp. GSS18]|nr:plasma-membrane proton-efflux P-type ATPase [Microbacter sp. GSS18]
MTDTELAPDDLVRIPLGDLPDRLGSAPEGLTAAEAADRLARNGPNAVEETARNPVLVFLGYFWAPIPWLIEIALVLSLVLRHWPDAAIIGALLVMNGLVAFYEEHQAADTIAALKKTLATSARVRRDGAWTDVPVAELVVGDVVHVALGDIVPADLRILDGEDVSVDQSALTGESLPVARDDSDELYSGSVLVHGQADAMVIATGAASYIGRTTALVASAGTTSHVQRIVLRIGRLLIYAALVLVVLTTAVSLLRGSGWLSAIDFGLVVIIASVPVAMPAVLSVTMAVGARQLAAQSAVVSHLPAVEELGSIDVLCSDKTGTLTQNRITVGEPWLAPDVSAERILGAAALATQPGSKDPIDAAAVAAAPDGLDAYRRTAFTPFDPVTKRTQAEYETSGGSVLRVTKGAPQAVISLCETTDADVRTAAEEAVTGFAAHGDRALAVAAAEGPDAPWSLLGVLPLADPPRPDSAETIRDARALGVEVKMITGDALAIGREVAGQVGIPGDLQDARRLPESVDAKTAVPDETADLVEEAGGFAQVFPEHKYLIVRALQSRDHIVGMTGDGVNDAPALKQADAGIAVSGATDAARAAADVVLLKPGLSVIVSAIRLAREIFGRMTSYTVYRIAETIRVLLLVSVSVIALGVRPVSAIMIVILALLNDGALLSIAYDRAKGADKPVRWDMRSVLTVSGSLGTVGVIETLGLMWLAWTVFGLSGAAGLLVIQTMVFLKLSVSGHLTVFVARTRGRFWTSPGPSWLLLGAVVIAQIIATIIAATGFLMAPLPWALIGVVWGWSLLWFLVEDQVKLAAYAWLDRRRPRSPNLGESAAIRSVGRT